MVYVLGLTWRIWSEVNFGDLFGSSALEAEVKFLKWNVNSS